MRTLAEAILGRLAEASKRESAWLAAFEDEVNKIDSKHAGKIDWSTAQHLFRQGKSSKEAAAQYCKNRMTEAFDQAHADWWNKILLPELKKVRGLKQTDYMGLSSIHGHVKITADHQVGDDVAKAFKNAGVTNVTVKRESHQQAWMVTITGKETEAK